MKKFLILLILVLISCVPTNNSDVEIKEKIILKIMTHDSFAIPEHIIQIFEAENNVTLQFLKTGDTGSSVNKAVLSLNNPLADVFYGIDNTFLSRGLKEGIFVAYQSPALVNVDDTFKLDPNHFVTPIDYGDVCLNFDNAYFEENNLSVPKTLSELTLPVYKSLLVVENPAISSPGLSFLFATIGAFGEEESFNYWQDLIENDVLIVNDWETAYYQEFSMWGGSRPIVVSYSSSPLFEYLYSEEEIEIPPTSVLTLSESCFRQIEFAGILKGTKNLTLAEKWIDYMLSLDFQNEILLNMYVFPVNNQIEFDSTYVEFIPNPSNPILLDLQLIDENRENWITPWRELIQQ
jgi:thiamine transport system substrate-binding protein